MPPKIFTSRYSNPELAGDKYTVCLLYTSYILNGTQVLPSVTTLMKPLSDTLYAGIRPETLQAAAERGTEVHSAIEDYVTPVSYTHLDVYKRQGYWCRFRAARTAMTWSMSWSI